MVFLIYPTKFSKRKSFYIRGEAVGISQFLLNPLLYVFILLIYLHYHKQMTMERQLFAVRIHSPWLQTIRSIGFGLLGGLLASIIIGLLGIAIQPADFWFIWVIAICLTLIRIRFLCLAYSVGILTVMHQVALFWQLDTQNSTLAVIWAGLQAVKPVPLLALVAVLHLVEALLIRWNAGQDASPLFVAGKRGKIIGSYQLHSFWLTPLVLMIPLPAGSGIINGPIFSGWPLFSPELSAASFGLLLLPAVTGFSDLTQTMLPQQKTREMSAQLVIYSVILLGLAYAAVWIPVLVVLAALYAVFGHEALLWFSQRRERQLAPYYIQSPKGVKVMAVIPHTPAEEIGILPGEVISKVNGIPVYNKQQLYQALQANAAFCKMELLSYSGEIKFVQCAVYAGRHHQLGIIVVPDETTMHYLDIRRINLVQLLVKRLGKMKLGA